MVFCILFRTRFGFRGGVLGVGFKMLWVGGRVSSRVSSVQGVGRRVQGAG